MSMISDYTKSAFRQLMSSMSQSHLYQPANRHGEGDFDDAYTENPSTMFFSAPGASRVRESIALGNSRMLYAGGIAEEDESDVDDGEEEAGFSRVEGGVRYAVGRIVDQHGMQSSDADLPYSSYGQESHLSRASDTGETPTPSAIYLDVPQPVTTDASTYKPSLNESLLPPTSSLPFKGTTNIHSVRKFKDAPFLALYVFTFIIWLLSGLILLIATNASVVDAYPTSALFTALRGSAGLFTFLIISFTVVGAVWILLLRSFAKHIVWGTVILVPLVTFTTFIWAMVESFTGRHSADGQRDPQDFGLTFLSFLPLLTGLVYVKVILMHTGRIKKTITLLELACEVLRDNPQIIMMSVGLVITFVTFSTIWLTLFSRIWLIGHGGNGVWIVDGEVTYLVLFYLGVYFWTCAILVNIQRFCIAGVTAQWYFHRHEPIAAQVDNPTTAALYRATTTSFGTICFGGMILSTVRTLGIVVRWIKKKSRQSSNPIFDFLLAVTACFDMFLEQVNHYTIIFAGITSEPFIPSAKSATKIFRRNLVTAPWLSGIFVRGVLYIGSLIAGLVGGFGGMVYASHSLGSSFGYAVGVFTAIIPYYICQFYTYIVMNIVDTAFMCWSIDLDTNSVNSDIAHEVFASME